MSGRSESTTHAMDAGVCKQNKKNSCGTDGDGIYREHLEKDHAWSH